MIVKPVVWPYEAKTKTKKNKEKKRRRKKKAAHSQQNPELTNEGVAVYSLSIPVYSKYKMVHCQKTTIVISLG